MSSETLAYTVKPHPVTAMYSGKFGTWLFLASEVMLFGALFSSYVLLRVGAPAEGPGHWLSHEEAHLSWKIGGVNTLLLVISSLVPVVQAGQVPCEDADVVLRMLVVVLQVKGSVFSVPDQMFFPENGYIDLIGIHPTPFKKAGKFLRGNKLDGQAIEYLLNPLGHVAVTQNADNERVELIVQSVLMVEASRYVIFALIGLIYLILGCFLSATGTI